MSYQELVTMPRETLLTHKSSAESAKDRIYIDSRNAMTITKENIKAHAKNMKEFQKLLLYIQFLTQLTKEDEKVI